MMLSTLSTDTHPLEATACSGVSYKNEFLVRAVVFVDCAMKLVCRQNRRSGDLCQVPGSRHSGEPLCERSGVVFNSNAVQCVSSWPAFKTDNKNFCTMPSLERSVDIVGDRRETQASWKQKDREASCFLLACASHAWGCTCLFKISLPGWLMQF